MDVQKSQVRFDKIEQRRYPKTTKLHAKHYISMTVTNHQPRQAHKSSGLVLNRNNTSLTLLTNRIHLAVQLLVSSSRRLISLILVLKQKGELLQRPASCLGPQEIDDDDFEAQEDDVGQQVLPLGVLHADRVDEGVEEAGAAAEQLEEGDAACSCGEWVKLDQKGVGERVVAHVVAGRVGEHPEDDEVTDGRAFRSEIALLRYRPASVYALSVC
jgi:hypothetical protein